MTMTNDEITAFNEALENKHWKKLIRLTRLDGFDRKICDQESFAPLISAAHNGAIEAAQELIKLGIDVNKKDEGGFTALIRAVDVGDYRMIALL